MSYIVVQAVHGEHRVPDRDHLRALLRTTPVTTACKVEVYALLYAAGVLHHTQRVLHAHRAKLLSSGIASTLVQSLYIPEVPTPDAAQSGWREENTTGSLGGT